MQEVRANNFHLHKSKIMSASLSLPDHFEVIIVGTDVTESVVAAAAARLGHSVLHIDTAGYYGGDSASFTLEGLTKWMDQQGTGEKKEEKQINADLLNEGEQILNLGEYKTIVDPQYTWHQNKQEVEEPQEPVSKSESNEENVDESEKKEDDPSDNPSVNTEKKNEKKKKVWKKEELLVESRRFNLDLNPRLLFARGSMVELLISSNISRYTEFKSVTRVLTQIDGRLEHVPSSRSDVFGTKHITVVEKRILMKFLSYCVNEKIEDILRDRENKSFTEFLSEENLTQNLIHFVMHSIAMVAPDTPVRQGLEATVKFLSSLGRFGSTPFLWSMYGTGELPQAFCRLCAVFGGVYYLGRELNGIIVQGTKCVGILTEGKRINCDHLVLPDKLTPQSVLPPDLHEVRTDRGIYVSESSVLPADKEQITLLSLPTKHDPLHIIEVGPGTAACPKGLQVVHVSCEHNDDEDSLKEAEEILPENSLLISFKFSQKTRKGGVKTELSNVYRASGPVPELDFEFCIQEAKEIFSLLYPTEEFLPRAPDPEEIIIGDEKEGNEEAPSSTSQESSQQQAESQSGNDSQGGQESQRDQDGQLSQESQEAKHKEKSVGPAADQETEKIEENSDNEKGDVKVDKEKDEEGENDKEKNEAST